ncbi:MAG: hypothetical protein ABI877_10640 [Gemmatimonadaceae bacterium]
MSALQSDFVVALVKHRAILRASRLAGLALLTRSIFHGPMELPMPSSAKTHKCDARKPRSAGPNRRRLTDAKLGLDII